MPRRRPPTWTPGAYLPPAYPGYTRREATAAVGPGWAELAGRAWDAVTAAGGRVSQVKEKFGRLTVYWDNTVDARHRWVSTEVEALGDESKGTCEACGRTGRLWPADDAETELLRAAHPLRGRRVSVFCDGCGWRFYHDGAQGWAEIRGGWTPELDVDNDLPDDDVDPPEAWRGIPDRGT